ncbi:hypothetical protein P153DRAFT_313198 [Dothidotthia symphoricarpi CBS 119687]|uniref:CENP-Q, a CENPA-CAD centromere complex subunit-domain-containing protein n=1 Tax=Dothidotthia symphoricarpi CBS 119687 TaxID=1392245 RepID=A0A6A6AJA7_9PLEO|nr:uncharacterized protein P153DRAFT_313198 [Dothidotthia symphoricarpi CBS 119687]KAF2130994.1 hypothetical protein P153DRAFT_313198 [Dothidotthia symphoricarpi CBS 119687]
MAPTRSNDNNTKKRRGRPPGSRTSVTATKRVAKPAAKKGRTSRKQAISGQAEDEDVDELSRVGRTATKQTTKPKGKRTKKQPSQGDSEDELSIAVDVDGDDDELSRADNAQPLRPRKRKVDAEQNVIAEEQSEPRKKYVQLEVKTKRIPQEQIDSWPQVSTQVLEQIVAVIRDAKKDIANTQRDERRVIAAHNILNPLVQKLARELSNSRIPPQAKDIHFNIDKLTERNAQVFREVTTARHAKQLLSEQVKVAEHLLKKDEESLEELKTNARKWKAEWKHQEKHGRLHPLLQKSDDTVIDSDGPDEIGLKRSSPVDTFLLDAPDSEFAPVLEQLRRSLENMQSNHAQVKGVDEAMKDTQAALDNILFRHASAQQYAAF